MTLHHTKHHQTYVNGLNAAEEAYAATDSTAKQIQLQTALKFNGGGHINHTLFWKNLAPANGSGGKLPSGGALEKAIVRDFGSLDNLKSKMNTATAGIQGSGWGWLVNNLLLTSNPKIDFDIQGYDPVQKKLAIVTTANQDPLLCTSYFQYIRHQLDLSL